MGLLDRLVGRERELNAERRRLNQTIDRRYRGQRIPADARRYMDRLVNEHVQLQEEIRRVERGS